jgi:hypothetical protein
VVFETDGRAVGMISGKRGRYVRGGRPSYTFTVPIKDISEDMKTFSEGEITDICIVEDS